MYYYSFCKFFTLQLQLLYLHFQLLNISSNYWKWQTRHGFSLPLGKNRKVYTIYLKQMKKNLNVNFYDLCLIHYFLDSFHSFLACYPKRSEMVLPLRQMFPVKALAFFSFKFVNAHFCVSVL